MELRLAPAQPTPVPEPSPKFAETPARNFKFHLRVGLTLGQVVLLTRATNGPLPYHPRLFLYVFGPEGRGKGKFELLSSAL
jgi:hypothetical protein